MERITCPYCGEAIAATAKKCRFCGEWLPNEPVSTIQQVPAPRQPAYQQVPAPRPYYKAESVETQRDEAYNEDDSLLTFFKAYFVNPYIRRYADFSGYTSRKSFWLTYVATLILGIGLTGLIMLLASFGMGGIIGGSIISGLIGLAMIVPGLALSVRRLRDAGKNPWLILLGLIPAVGSIILLIFFCQKSQYEDSEEKGSWQIPDWIVAGVCAVLLILGIIFSLKSLSSLLGASDAFDLDAFETEDIYEVDYDEPEEMVAEEVAVYDGKISPTRTLADLSENLNPQFFTHQLVIYRMGSDKKMEHTYYRGSSTNVPIHGDGWISDHYLTLDGWITEDGTIHGRYHNENGINLDFNGYIRPDNSLYIQLGHDNEESDWYLYPVDDELGSGYCRYEGKWGKSRKDSYVVFSAEKNIVDQRYDGGYSYEATEGDPPIGY